MAHEAVKKWLSPPQRRRDAEKGPFVFKPLRLRASAVRRVFGDYFTASHAVGYLLSPAPRADFINERLRHAAGCPESPLQPARPVELEEFNPGLIPV